MYRRAKRPLNPDAVAAANAAVAGETGGRLLTMGPEDADLRKKWMDAYIRAGGAYDIVAPTGKTPAAPTTPCPAPGLAHLAVHVQDCSGTPIAGVTVSVGGQGWAGVTDSNGNFDFGDHPPATYTVNGEKTGYSPAPASQTLVAAAWTDTQYTLTLNCWADDYDKAISVNSYGRYFKKYKADGTEYSYTFSKHYKILAPVKCGDKITVEVRFKAEVQTGVSAADATAAKTKLEDGVKTHWTHKSTLEVDDPVCGKKAFSIEYKIVWVDSGQDYTIKIYNTYPREGLSGNIMNVAKSTSAWTYAHEFAHCVGLPDEYSYSTDTETVKYIKPDGTLDSAISAPPDGKSKTAADATIMSAVDNTTVLKRHFWNIAIEVQELLTTKLGRAVKCSIQ